MNRALNNFDKVGDMPSNPEKKLEQQRVRRAKAKEQKEARENKVFERLNRIEQDIRLLYSHEPIPDEKLAFKIVEAKHRFEQQKKHRQSHDRKNKAAERREIQQQLEIKAENRQYSI